MGVIEAPGDAGEDGIIPIAKYLLAHATNDSAIIERASTATIPTAATAGYVRMDEPKLVEYILSNDLLCDLLNIPANSDHAVTAPLLKVAEIGDGNINFVYIVEGPGNRQLIIKQALPYVRCVGENWPMTLRRAYFETTALNDARKMTKGKFVPEVYHFDQAKALIGKTMRFASFMPHPCVV